MENKMLSKSVSLYHLSSTITFKIFSKFQYIYVYVINSFKFLMKFFCKITAAHKLSFNNSFIIKQYNSVLFYYFMRTLRKNLVVVIVNS